MKKAQILQLIFILIIVSNCFFVVNVKAVDYNLELASDANLIWKVEEFDEDRYEELITFYTGIEPDFEEDDQRQIRVTNIDERTDKWVITYDLWEYTDDDRDFSEEPDKEKYRTVYKNPGDQEDKLLFPEDIVGMWVVPSPYINYIEELRDKENNPGIDIGVEDDKLIAKDPIEEATYEIEVTYGNDGLAEKIEYIDDDEDTFLEIRLLEEEIPGYHLFIFVLIAGIIGSIIIWKRKVILKLGTSD